MQRLVMPADFFIVIAGFGRRSQHLMENSLRNIEIAINRAATELDFKNMLLPAVPHAGERARVDRETGDVRDNIVARFGRKTVKIRQRRKEKRDDGGTHAYFISDRPPEKSMLKRGISLD